MNWILIGILAGSLVTGTFETEEACQGRVATLKKKDVAAECHRAPTPPGMAYSNGGYRNQCTMDGGRTLVPC